MSGLAQVWVSSFMIFVILDTSFNFLKPWIFTCKMYITCNWCQSKRPWNKLILL
jgi:hypothetical protein